MMEQVLKAYFKKILSLFFLFFCLGPKAASPDSLFCKKLKPANTSSLWLFSAGYKLPVNKTTIINSGHGFYVEGGINPGYFFSKKLVLGVYAGWAWKDNLWSTSFNRRFISDYKASMNNDVHFSGLDSAVISGATEAMTDRSGRSLTMPGCEMTSFHNYSLYYGIVLRLPQPYSPALKLYYGSTRSHFQGNGNLTGRGKDYTIFQLRRAMYGCELIVFRGFQSKSNDGRKFPLSKNTGCLSLYYETCNFYSSSLYYDDGEKQANIPLKRFTSENFLKKYRSEAYWGVKVSFCIM